jgi:hypothetical protein
MPAKTTRNSIKSKWIAEDTMSSSREAALHRLRPTFLMDLIMKIVMMRKKIKN